MRRATCVKGVGPDATTIASIIDGRDRRIGKRKIVVCVGGMACMGQSRMPRSRSDPDQPRLQYERVRMPGDAER
jgi:hypothetical protein